MDDGKPAVTALPELSNGPTVRFQNAIEYLVEAWTRGTGDGIPDEELAQATLLTALAAMVKIHGEAKTAELLDGLPVRVRSGEFALDKLLQ